MRPARPHQARCRPRVTHEGTSGPDPSLEGMGQSSLTTDAERGREAGAEPTCPGSVVKGNRNGQGWEEKGSRQLHVLFEAEAAFRSQGNSPEQGSVREGEEEGRARHMGGGWAGLEASGGSRRGSHLTWAAGGHPGQGEGASEQEASRQHSTRCSEVTVTAAGKTVGPAVSLWPRSCQVRPKGNGRLHGAAGAGKKQRRWRILEPRAE